MKASVVLWSNTRVSFHACWQIRFLDGVQKLTFHRCRDSLNFRVTLSCFLTALGLVFMTFAALEIGSKSDDFFMVIPGGSWAEAIHRWTH